MYNLDSGESKPLNGSLNYYTTLQLKLFHQRSGKWDEIPYVQAFMTLYNEDADAGLKGNRLMAQRKGNLPAADSISSKERDQEDQDVMAAVSMFQVPTAPPTLGYPPPYPTERAEGGEPELVSPSQVHQGTKFGRRQAPTGTGQYLM